MRQAVIHLRALFAELLEVEEPQPVRRQTQDQNHMETQS